LLLLGIEIRRTPSSREAASLAAEKKPASAVTSLGAWPELPQVLLDGRDQQIGVGGTPVVDLVVQQRVANFFAEREAIAGARRATVRPGRFNALRSPAG
jgi:hypothetical protein